MNDNFDINLKNEQISRIDKDKNGYSTPSALDQVNDTDSCVYEKKEDHTDGTLNMNSYPKGNIQFQRNDDRLSNPFPFENPDKTIHYQEHLYQMENKKKHTEEMIMKLECSTKELQAKLEQMEKQRDCAVKEKEIMVVRFAVAEKNVLKEKFQRETLDKKYKEILRENEILQHKVQTVVSEKSRICQLLDNKCYEHKSVQQELERIKIDSTSLETKLKWSQNNLKVEMENHKETQNDLAILNAEVREMADTIKQSKSEADESIRLFQHSEGNRAHILDQQIQAQQATTISLRHGLEDKEEQIKILTTELQRLQSKQKDMLQENNDLSLKVQQLERDRSESEQRFSELKSCADQQRQDSADMQTLLVQLEQLKLQMKHEQDQLIASNDQINLLKKRNSELESDMENCRLRESELLSFTQQLTDKNVRLQSEFTSMETQVQQLTCEQTLLKRQIMEQETRANNQIDKSLEKMQKHQKETEDLSKSLKEMCKLCDHYKEQLTDLKAEETLMKRRFEMSSRVRFLHNPHVSILLEILATEMNKELQQCRKKIEQLERTGNRSRSLYNVNECPPDQIKDIYPDIKIEKETLEQIVKLQRLSAKKSEKIDFLEEHVNTLVLELQKKSKLLQSYILLEQCGTLPSNKMNNNKAKSAESNGARGALNSSRTADDNLTLESSQDINWKLQAVLEDALLRNITLKENVDTLGSEIENLNKLIISSCNFKIS